MHMSHGHAHVELHVVKDLFEQGRFHLLKIWRLTDLECIANKREGLEGKPGEGVTPGQIASSLTSWGTQAHAHAPAHAHVLSFYALTLACVCTCG